MEKFLEMNFARIMLDIVLICYSAQTPRATEDGSNQWKLTQKLFSSYDRTLRPVQFLNTTTNVTLNPMLYSIIGTDEVMENIGISLWQRMAWNDEYLTWNPSDFGGINLMKIPMSKIWYPDVVIMNTVDNVKTMMTDDVNLAYVSFDGTVDAFIDQIATVHCNYKIINFPFDVQNCTILMASWALTSDEANLFPTSPTDLSAYQPHSEWDLISFTSRRVLTIYSQSVTPFSDVHYDIVIQRKYSYYLMNFVLPSFIITTLSIIGIFSPFSDTGGREEKVTMGLTTLLTMAVILLIVTQQVPKSSEGLPLLGLTRIRSDICLLLPLYMNRFITKCTSQRVDNNRRCQQTYLNGRRVCRFAGSVGFTHALQGLHVLFQILLAASASIVATIIMFEHSKWTTGQVVPNWILTVTRLKGTEHIQWKKSDLNWKSNAERSNESRTEQDRTSIILDEINMSLKRIAEKLHENEMKEELGQMWNRAMRRLDLIFMIIFVLLNVLLTVLILACGFASLVKR